MNPRNAKRLITNEGYRKQLGLPEVSLWSRANRAPRSSQAPEVSSPLMVTRVIHSEFINVAERKFLPGWKLVSIGIHILAVRKNGVR